MLICHDFLGRYPNPAPLDVLEEPAVTYWEPGRGWIKGVKSEDSHLRITLEEVPRLEVGAWIRKRVDELGVEEGLLVLLGAEREVVGKVTLFGLYHVGPEDEAHFEGWYDSPYRTPWEGVPTCVQAPTLWDHLDP